ncbi:MAG: hypothetical protein M0Z67_09435 [Nitrospiraceae bacterium]|nr:hypothetical protein [Nitrospiraceae bacterium]
MTSNTTGVLNFVGVRPATDIFDRAIKTTAAPVAISALWDTDTYTGADIRTATGFNIGLAEYTNANFFSEDTIFRDYPHPTYDDTNYQVAMNSPVLVDAEDGKLDSRAYIKKTVGDADARLAAFSYISYDILKKGKTELSPFVLDDEVYKDYSALLIPRAVGYTTALLDYFFRGDIRLGFETSPVAGYVFTNNTGEKMEGDFDIYYDTPAETRAPLWRGTGWIGPNGDRAAGIDFIPPADEKEGGKYIVVFKGKMGNEDGAVAGYVFHRLIEISPPERFVYSMISADENTRQFTELRAKVRNASNETIGSGSLQAVVKYKKTVDDETYSYTVSGARPVSSLSETASEFTFDFRQEPIPIDATDVRLIILFKGMIGQEQNALAMGERDISEPTPVDFFNNMDLVCIDGSWYVAGSQEAVAQVDADHDGVPEWDIYPHDIQDAYLKVSPGNAGKEAGPGDFTFHISSLKAGGFSRAYVLSEYEASHSSHVTKVTAEAADTWPHAIGQKTWPGAALKNQVELHGDEGYCRTVGLPAPCYVDNRNVMYPFRGRQMWGSMGVIFDNPPFPPGSTCEWDALR